MSIEEFLKMSKGLDMKPYNVSHYNLEITNSEGFCFIGEKTIGESENGESFVFDPEESFSFLGPTVNDDILVEFEAPDDINIKEGYGKYHNPHDGAIMTINEYSLMEYNKDIIKPVRFILCPNRWRDLEEKIGDWKEFSENEDYNIRDLITQIVQAQIDRLTFISFYIEKTYDNFKYLPPLPNTSKDEIWRIIRGDENDPISLIYGNPITDEKRYELKFYPDSEKVDFGEDIPEFWKELKELYDNNKFFFDSDGKQFLILAVFTAQFPQLLKTFSFNAKINEYRKGEYDYQFRSKEPNPPYEFDLWDIQMTKTKDGKIDFINSKSIVENFGNNGIDSIIDLMKKDIPNLKSREHEEQQRKVEWNRRLLEYKQKIDSNMIEKEDVPKIIEDIFYNYQADSDNPIRIELKSKLEKIKSIIAEYYQCEESEVCVGNTVFDEAKSYVIILGDLSFNWSFEGRDLGKLKVIAGNADFSDCGMFGIGLGDLEYIGGKINWGEFREEKYEYEKRLAKLLKKTKSPLQQREEELSKLEAEAQKFSELENLRDKLEQAKGQCLGE